MYGAIFAFSGHLYLLVTHFGWDQLRLILPAALTLGAIGALSGGVATGAFAGRVIMQTLSRIAPNAILVASLGMVLVPMEGARLASQPRELCPTPHQNAAGSLWGG